MRLTYGLFLISMTVLACGTPDTALQSVSHLSDVSELATSEGITNFHQVDAALFRSGRPEVGQIKTLPSFGIKTVVSLETYDYHPGAADAEKEAVLTAGMRFIRVPLSPLPFVKPRVSQIEQVLFYLTNPQLQPVLVHCYHGSDRVGISVGAYHIRVHGWTADQAIDDMYLYGHSTLFSSWDDILYEIH